MYCYIVPFVGVLVAVSVGASLSILVLRGMSPRVDIIEGFVEAAIRKKCLHIIYYVVIENDYS